MYSNEIRLKHCINILNNFPKDSKSLTIHVEDYFKDISNIIEEDKVFIIDVFAETIKFYKILAVVINRFYENDGRNIFQSDKNLYFVLLFLIIFRIEEIGLESLKQYVNVNKLSDMYKFLNFITDEKNLSTWIEMEWKKLYDSIFVENELMNNFKKWLPQLRTFVQEMKNVLDNKPVHRSKTLASTKPVPFDLHKPKPKRIPMPEIIPEIEKVKEIPASTYIAPDPKNKPTKKDPNILIKEAERLKPSCAQREISKKTIDKLNQIVIERDKELKFNDYKSRPAPKITANSTGTLKLNTATILREWKLYQNKIKRKNQKLKDLEEGAFDSQEFESWQQSMRATDLAEKIAQLEKQKLSGKISYEEAILKREQLVQENKELVKMIKKENEKRLEIFNEEKLLNEEKMKELVNQITEIQENVKEAKLTVQKQKKAIVKEIMEESRRLQEEMLIQAEEEMRRKIELISEIRALEGIPSNNKKVLDPTEIAGYGLLCEMSLMELKERLVLSKKKYEEYLSEKREIILENKQQKEKQINETLELIKICRTKFNEKEIKDVSYENSPLDNLNEEQKNELNCLRNLFEEKRILRQTKQNRDNSSLKCEKPKTIHGMGDLEKLQLKSKSKTVERMAQILSI